MFVPLIRPPAAVPGPFSHLQNSRVVAVAMTTAGTLVGSLIAMVWIVPIVLWAPAAGNMSGSGHLTV